MSIERRVKLRDPDWQPPERAEPEEQEPAVGTANATLSDEQLQELQKLFLRPTQQTMVTTDGLQPQPGYHERLRAEREQRWVTTGPLRALPANVMTTHMAMPDVQQPVTQLLNREERRVVRDVIHGEQLAREIHRRVEEELGQTRAVLRSSSPAQQRVIAEEIRRRVTEQVLRSAAASAAEAMAAGEPGLNVSDASPEPETIRARLIDRQNRLYQVCTLRGGTNHVRIPVRWLRVGGPPTEGIMTEFRRSGERNGDEWIFREVV